MGIENREPGEKKLTVEEHHEKIMAASKSLDEAIDAIRKNPESAQSPEVMEALSHIPQNGNDAYTIYHGRERNGVLEALNSQYGGRITGWIVPKDPKEDWGFHGHKEAKGQQKKGEKPRSMLKEFDEKDIDNLRGLTVGYEDGIRWDEEKKMYYAPADSD